MEVEVDVRQQLAQQLQARREKLGKTRQDVEREAAVAAGIVHRVEERGALPTIETLVSLCASLNCTFVISTAGIVLNAI